MEKIDFAFFFLRDFGELRISDLVYCRRANSNNLFMFGGAHGTVYAFAREDLMEKDYERIDDLFTKSSMQRVTKIAKVFIFHVVLVVFLQYKS
jgi:hypothetical protein